MTFARSRLVAPALPPEASWSDGLVERLADRTASTRLTLLRANGGAGKTTLAGAIAREAGVPWAWCVLDEHDDLATTVELVVHALRSAIPALDEALDGLDVATGQDAARTTAIAVTNAIVDAEVERVLLVVDDAHQPADPAVAAFLAELVATAAPGQHLVVTTRTELPGLGGARAVALGEVVAVDAEVLRVDLEVARRILAGLGRDVGEDRLRQVVERTGGWVLGVRLMAAMDDDEVDADDLVRRYVAEEVLADRSPDEAAALESLAVLEVVTGDAVATMISTADVRAWLRRLVTDLPLLVVRIDQDTVRLHDLLREVLLERLATRPSLLAAAHLRAADVATSWRTRADHLLAAQADDRAAIVLAAAARDEFPRPVPLGQVAERVERLAPAVQAAHPWLRVVRGVVLAQRRAGDDALELLMPARDDLPDDDVLGRWAAIRYGQAVTRGVQEFTGWMLEIEHAPRFADLPAGVRTDHAMGIAHAMVFAGRPEESRRRHERAAEIARTSRDPAAIEVLAQHQSPFMAQVPGGVDRIRRWAAWVDREVTAPSDVVRLGAHTQRAAVAFYTGDLDRAVAEVVAASTLADRHELAYLRPQLDWILASVWLTRGDLAPAAALLERRRRTPGPLVDTWIGPLARIRAAQEDTEALREIAATPEPPEPPDGGPQHAGARAAHQLARAELARLDGAPDDAVRRCEQVCDETDSLVFTPGLGRLQLDLVVALEAANRPDDALRLLLDELPLLAGRELLGLVACRGQALLPTVERAIDGGFRLELSRRVQAILARSDRPASFGLDGGGKLSPREVEVLRLVASGHSNREIAEELVLSINTVKTHVRNVLGKLGVTSRAAAASQATGMGLGSP